MNNDRIETLSHPKDFTDSASQKSIKKIAILFTDIIGSTKYFKTHGDQAGRLMLGRHYSVASEVIHEFRGSVIKSIGDSIMAYFLTPQEALKSAIGIQQEYSEYNKVRNGPDQIHIRISVHFGYGIMEEDDIYGDVVNVAAKLTSFAKGDQVYVSQEVYDETADLQNLEFELIDVSKVRNVPDGLIVYRVLWDETIRFDPMPTPILCLKPIWELAGDFFKQSWNTLVDIENKTWREKIEKKIILSDGTLALHVKDDESILDIAYDFTSYLNDNFKEENEKPFFPIYMVIDSGYYVRADKLDLRDFHVSWETIEAGEVYISCTAHEILKKICASLPMITGEANQSGSFIKINFKKDKEEEGTSLFLYHDALIGGEHPPCYYCGSKKHLISSCSSKHLPEITNAIDKIGYKSIEEINRIYFDYLTRFNSDIEEKYDESNIGDAVIAHQVFYDLKRFFQLRFLRTIWDTGDKVWDNVKSKMCEGNRSGIPWIAQDCIRVSNLLKAESILEDSLVGNQDDYKVYCTMGFLNIEQERLALAEHFFCKALKCSKTNPEKIFILFLLYRIYAINDNLSMASEKIREIMAIDSHCSDALYLDIVMQFHRGGTEAPLRKLLKLIHSKREYYIYALIDPDLKLFKDIIVPELKNLLNAVRDEAKRILCEAEGELKKLRGLLGDEENTVKKAAESWVKINKYIETDSYFGLLDGIYYSDLIKKTVHKVIEDYKKELYDSFSNLIHQLRKYLKFASTYQNRNLIGPIQNKLENFQNRVNENWRKIETCTPDELVNVSNNMQLLLQELDHVEQKIKRLATIQWLKQFFSKCLKRNIIFISATLLIAFMLMPIAIFYINLILINLNISPIYQIWFYQKMITIIGCICSILTSFSITYIDVPKENFLLK